MTDITARLREVTAFLRFETGDRIASAASLPEEAAHEIERLRVMAYQPRSQHRDGCDCIQCMEEER